MATRPSSLPVTHRPSVGLVASELEDQYSESEPFQVSSFGRTHSQRTTYKALPVDNALLSASVPFDFSELRQQRFSGLSSSDGEHPLRSMRAETSAAAAGDNAPRAKRRRHQGRTNSVGATSCFQQPVAPMCAATTLAAAAPASSAAATGAGEQAALPEGTVLLRVAFYRQHIHVRTVEVHSGHTLSDLSSALGGCLTGVQLARQHHELAKRDAAAAAALRPPSNSAAFCIEGSWYTSGNEDLSMHVRPWLAAHGRAPPPPRPMDATTLGSLTIRLGRQYLFVHHGDCEHALVFVACWLAPSSSAVARQLAAVPCIIFRRKEVPMQCVVCLRAPAVWVVHGDVFADASPCYLCQRCHFHSHYTAEGEARRLDYRVYPILREDDEDEQREVLVDGSGDGTGDGMAATDPADASAGARLGDEDALPPSAAPGAVTLPTRPGFEPRSAGFNPEHAAADNRFRLAEDDEDDEESDG